MTRLVSVPRTESEDETRCEKTCVDANKTIRNSSLLEVASAITQQKKAGLFPVEMKT